MNPGPWPVSARQLFGPARFIFYFIRPGPARSGSARPTGRPVRAGLWFEIRPLVLFWKLLKVVLGRLTENRTETAVFKKPTTEPTSVFKKPKKTENR